MIKIKVWMAVTNDKYEFPICVADSAYELSKFLNIKENTIYRYKRIKDNKCRINRNYKIIPVEIEEDNVYE